MRAMGERAADESGASAVEFAIVASVLFMIMFGTIQFGLAYNRYQGLQAGAREGARLGSVGGTYSQIFQRVKDSVSTIDTSSAISPCSPNPPTTTGIMCVNISVVTSSGTLSQLPSNTAVPPCVTAGQTNPSAPTIDVQAKYKMAMAIPFVAGFQPVLTGEGRFRCEQ
jgi:Flp pilus assembly protein TadG